MSQSKPVVCGIFPRPKPLDIKIALQKPLYRDRSRSPLLKSDEEDMFYTPPTSPSALCSSSPFKPPPRVPSPGHWDGEMTREVYLKSDSDFDNPDGALSSLLLSGCSKPRKNHTFVHCKLYICAL